MGYVIASGQGADTSVAAYGKSANLITGRNQFLPKGRLQLFARGSAIGTRLSLSVGGVSLVDDVTTPSIGTTGAMSTNDNGVIDQVVAGGVCEFYIRNTTVGALTCDYLIVFTPMK